MRNCRKHCPVSHLSECVPVICILILKEKVQSVWLTKQKQALPSASQPASKSLFFKYVSEMFDKLFYFPFWNKESVTHLLRFCCGIEIFPGKTMIFEYSADKVQKTLGLGSDPHTLM